MHKLKKLFYYIIPLSIIFFNFIIIINPYKIINSSKFAINLWANNVVPSLLPFIICNNLLIELGVVNFLGTILEPLMKPIFNVPGVGGFAFITGISSGYPLGAKVISDLRIKKEISKYEAQRLISFCNNSGPLFILGAVGVNIFKNVKVGYFIMIIHYLSAIITGFIFKYYKYNNKNNNYNLNKNIILKSFLSMKLAREKNKKTFGEILSNSISNSIQTILNIGGFIIIFCILVKIINILCIIQFLENYIFHFLLIKFNISQNCFSGFLTGLIEITNGSAILGLEQINKIQILSVTFIISFGGLSILAQSISFLSKTDINIYIYIISKLLHSIISVILGILIYPFFNFDDSTYVFNSSYKNNFYNFSTLSSTFNIFFSLTFALIFISLVINFHLKFKTK